MIKDVLPHGLPKVGMRNIKTATAAALCALVYYFFDASPAFACIGAIFGTGNNLENSKLHGGNRFFGSLIGGLLSIVLYRVYLFFRPDGGTSLLLVPLLFVGIVILIVLCQIMWIGGVQPGGVVLCIVLFNITPDNYVSYALHRIFDTGVGVLAALLVNSLFPGGFTFMWVERMYRSFRKTWGDLAGPVQPVTKLKVLEDAEQARQNSEEDPATAHKGTEKL